MGELNEPADIDTSSLITLVGHFYRGEIDRMTTWRGRMDQTTYWSVTIMAAVLTWSFSSPDNPHYLLLIGMGAVGTFLFFEARRYQAYDLWRTRVRLVEENFLATTFDPSVGLDDEEWRSKLSDDLREPRLKISLLRGVGHRLRRVYLPLLTVMLAAWLFRITAFESPNTWLETSAIDGIPGWIVVSVVFLGYLGIVVLAFIPLVGRDVAEFHERNATDEWYDK